MTHHRCSVAILLFAIGSISSLVCTKSVAQSAKPEQEQQIRQQLKDLQHELTKLKNQNIADDRLADVAIYAKAAEWILRHNEFFKPNYADQTLEILELGLQKAQRQKPNQHASNPEPGSYIFAYRSKVDGSLQPYALTVPKGVDLKDAKRWPLHVKLHGRAKYLNEVNFINRYADKPLPESAADRDWIQLDVFGRTNNAYRWAGEADVLEAIADVRRRFRIDVRRITLWGFSMGGAGAWHLGLHYPSKWSSVGPGAGFVDFYKYQKVAQPLPIYQHKTLHIYDAIDYALNAYNVPICTYGGEKDSQLVASTSVVEKAESLNVPIKLLIGEGMGHKFHPDSYKEFMAFHKEKSKAGRPGYPGLRQIRFITYTLKYNSCEWLTIEEMAKQYEPATVAGAVDPKTFVLNLETENVAILQIARDIAEDVVLDGMPFPLAQAARGLLPGVFFERTSNGWVQLDYDSSRDLMTNPDLRKRHDLQGPIDDAFMQPFLCVTGTHKPSSTEHEQWAQWTLKRFEQEFDKWMRGRIPIVNDDQVTANQIRNQNLVLFGDPASNSIIAKIIDKLPIEWSGSEVTVAGKTYDTTKHGLSMIYPNPLNPRRYVVLNSGHTFHTPQFMASNAQLYPRLGDIAVQSFEPDKKLGYREKIVWADLFNASWELDSARSEQNNQ